MDNWAYKDTGFLKAQVEATGLYERHDDYFIAYKGIRSDRYSNYNFQYRYFPGEVYEAFCDCSPDEDSFGLSVWTEEKAKGYCDELVVKVKVKYEDVGRVERERPLRGDRLGRERAQEEQNPCLRKGEIRHIQG